MENKKHMENEKHIVKTSHIRKLIESSLALAEDCHNVMAGGTIPVHGFQRVDNTPIKVPVEHALQKAAADLRHAAEELEAERLSVLGWAQE